MPTPVIAAAITGGASLVGGLMGRKKAKQTSTSQQIYSPDQLAMQSRVAGSLNERLTNPANLAPLKTAAASSVNRGFDAAGDRLTSRLSARGFGSSGKLVTNQKNLEIGRAGALGDLESRFAGMQIDQDNQTLQDAQRFSFGGGGIKSESEQSGPGALAGAVGGGVETASLLYALNHFMGGGGGLMNGGGADYDA